MLLPADITFDDQKVIIPGDPLRVYYYEHLLMTSQNTYVTLYNTSPYSLNIEVYIVGVKAGNREGLKPGDENVFEVKSSRQLREPTLLIENSNNKCKQVMEEEGNEKCRLII